MATQQLVRTRTIDRPGRTQRKSRETDMVSIRHLRSALKPVLSALRKLARYRLEPELDRLMLDMGERKEFLGKQEHDLLLGLVHFTERRTLEKLEATVILKELGEQFPELINGK